MYRNQLVKRGLVLAQFVICAWIVLMTRTLGGPVLLQLLVIASILGGAVIAIWAWLSMGMMNIRVMPDPTHGGGLVRRGPYARIRHPMYSGVLLAMLGLVLGQLSIGRVLGFLVLAMVLFVKSEIEEHLLMEKFAGYAAYRSQAGRFLPRWRSAI